MLGLTFQMAVKQLEALILSDTIDHICTLNEAANRKEEKHLFVCYAL